MSTEENKTEAKTNNQRLNRATWRIMEQLLEVDSLDEALSGSLEIILRELESEAGILWFLDKKTERLFPSSTWGRRTSPASAWSWA